MLSLRGVSKFHDSQNGLHPISLEIPKGERLVILGPTGSGKTTLLRVIAGLEKPDSGEILFDGRRWNDVQPHERGITYLAQRPALYPHLRIREQLSQGVDDPLSMGNPELLDRFPHELSSGEKQRIALVRGLTRQARLWLLDEPFAALDPVLRSEIRVDLHLLQERLAATMILVTHDPIDALALGCRVGVLGDGRLQQLGTPGELADQPGNRFVAFALGRLSLIDGKVCGGESSEIFWSSDDGSVQAVIPSAMLQGIDQRSNRTLTLGIRPEDIQPMPTGNAIPRGARFLSWPVVSAEPVGSGWCLIAARGRNRIRISHPSQTPPRDGHPENWFVSVDLCLWFDHTGQRITVGSTEKS